MPNSRNPLLAQQPDNEALASVGMTTHRLCHVWTHPFEVSALAISPNEDLVAIGGKDVDGGACEFDLAVWNLASRDLITTIWTTDPPVASVAFSPDSTKIAAMGADGRVVIADSRSGEVEQRFEAASWEKNPRIVKPQLLAWSPDGRTVVTGGGYLALWDASRGTRIAQEFLSDTLNPGVCSVAFSPDGRYLAACCGRWLKVWSVSFPTSLGKVLERKIGPSPERFGRRVWFSEDSALYVASVDYERRWSGTSGAVWRYGPLHSKADYGQDVRLRVVSNETQARMVPSHFAVDSSICDLALAGAKGIVTVVGLFDEVDHDAPETATVAKGWHVLSGAPAFSIKTGRPFVRSCVVTTADARNVLCSIHNKIEIWKQTADVPRKCEDLDLTTTAGYIKSSANDNRLKVKRCPPDRWLLRAASLETPFSATAYGARGRLLAAATSSVGVWNFHRDNRLTKIYDFPVDGVATWLAFGGDDKYLAIASLVPTAKKPLGGAFQLQVYDMTDGRAVTVIENSVAACFSPTGQALAVAELDAETQETSAMIYSLRTRNERLRISLQPFGIRIEGPTLTPLIFSPDESLLVFTQPLKGRIGVFESHTGQLLWNGTCEDLSIKGMKPISQGNWIATFGRRKDEYSARSKTRWTSLQLWQLDPNQRESIDAYDQTASRRSLYFGPYLSEDMFDCAFSRDGEKLAALHGVGVLSGWSLADRRHIFAREAVSVVDHFMEFSLDGSEIVVGCREGIACYRFGDVE